MKVTAIIICYNEENIENSLKSICQQTFRPEEVIIIDDGSNDEIKVLNLEVPIPIRIIRNERNMGRGFCRNIGIIQCKSEYALFCDASNSLCNDFTEKALVSFNDKKVAAVFGSITGRNDHTDVCSRWRERNLFLQTYPDAKEPYEVFSLSTYSVMLRKSHILSIGNFKKDLRKFEDHDLGVRIIKNNYSIFFNPSLYCISNKRDNFLKLAIRIDRWYSPSNVGFNFKAFVDLQKTAFTIWAKRDINSRDYGGVLLSLCLPFIILFQNLINDYSKNSK